MYSEYLKYKTKKADLKRETIKLKQLKNNIESLRTEKRQHKGKSQMVDDEIQGLHHELK